MTQPLLWLCVIQSLYFGVTGLWPIFHIRSFMAVTGPKTDLWLVKTVGALVTVVAIVLGSAARRNAITLEIAVLAVGTAAALTAIDIYYVARRVIARIYLIDAFAEILLITGWLLLWRL